MKIAGGCVRWVAPDTHIRRYYEVGAELAPETFAAGTFTVDD